MPEAVTTERKFVNSLPDWGARALLFALFLFVGAAKFKSDPDAPWVEFFNDLGLGQWLRYLTGSLEIAGAFLVLIPQTVIAGFVVLLAVLGSAMLLVLIMLHKPSEATIAFALFCAIIAFWMHRRRV